jgi:hypothetical protein
VQLDVHCPSTTLAHFLVAVRNATGLRGEYPPELASARVSITVKRATLAKALENALSGFNFAVWPDQQTRAGIFVSILGARHTDLPDGMGAVESAHSPDAGSASAPPRAAEDVRTARSAKRPEREQTFQGQIGGQAATSAGSANDAPPRPAELAPARSETVLEAALPNATLLTAPTAGRTPILPQRADGVVLRPVP